MKYKEITDDFVTHKKYQLNKQKYFISDNGTKYNVNGRHVILNPSEREIRVARLLGEMLGGKVNIIPKINEPPNIKTPDYIINNEKYDLKQITGKGKYVIEGNLRGKREQANNFIIDITNAKIDLKEAERQIRSIYISKRYWWVNKIFVIKDSKLEKAYEKQKAKVNCEPKKVWGSQLTF